MAIQITERGKQTVASPDFAQLIKSVLVKYELSSAQERVHVAFILIAWALMGRDVTAPPRTADEQTDLAVFIESNRKAINDVSDKIAATLFAEGYVTVQ